MDVKSEVDSLMLLRNSSQPKGEQFAANDHGKGMDERTLRVKVGEEEKSVVVGDLLSAFPGSELT